MGAQGANHGSASKNGRGQRHQEEEGMKKEKICRAYHGIENQLIDVICAGQKDGSTLASIGKPKPKSTTHTYIVIEFYNNSFLFVVIVTYGAGRSQMLWQLPNMAAPGENFKIVHRGWTLL
jgi:hypothetical protein